jgi:Nif-specific regulatory protein
VEREMIVEALKSARGNMAEAARKLGISERMIGLRVERFRVDLEKLRRSS